MIYDRMEAILNYRALLPGLEEMLEKAAALSGWEPGRHGQGDGFFLLQEGELKPETERRFELHKKYIDVHILVEGSEEVAWDVLEKLSEDTPFNQEKDIAFYRGTAKHVTCLKPGMFCVFFPGEPHITQMYTEQAGSYRKVVFKLPAC